MTEENEISEYVVQSNEAAIIIRPNGDVEVLMPQSDEDKNGMLSSDSPSFKALVIMAFVRNRELRKQVTEDLIKEHFSS